MRRAGGPIVVLAIGLSLCLTAPPPAAAASTAQLKAKTLSLSDLPAGWSVENATTGPISNLGGCLTQFLNLKKAPPRGVVRARVSYKDGELSVLQETVEAGKGALTHYDKYLGIISNCRRISFNAQGVTFTGTVTPLAFPQIGQMTHAFKITIAAEGVSIGADIVMFRVGQYNCQILYGSIPLNTPAVEALATEAMVKIEGKPVGPLTSV